MLPVCAVRPLPSVPPNRISSNHLSPVSDGLLFKRTGTTAFRLTKLAQQCHVVHGLSSSDDVTDAYADSPSCRAYETTSQPGVCQSCAEASHGSTAFRDTLRGHPVVASGSVCGRVEKYAFCVAKTLSGHRAVFGYASLYAPLGRAVVSDRAKNSSCGVGDSQTLWPAYSRGISFCRAISFWHP
jgi:hypothetical protein